MKAETVIQQAKASFDRVLANEKYAGIIRDDRHLALLLGMLNVQENSSILDLGTGNGYLAFPLAAQHPSVQVCGLDIAPEAIARANVTAQEQGLVNARFLAYDGLHFPFAPASFDLIVTRYALHHFPQPDAMLSALHSLLKPGGHILVADPMAHGNDDRRLIDSLMTIKGDGHICFYKQAELAELFHRHHFAVEKQIISHMRYPFPRNDAYNTLFAQTSETERQMYQLSDRDGIVWVGQIEVGNTLFVRQ
ncbi:MAG: methyltransferase domain-containing protein [Clostridia bacterium]|nr:methyltransferase domain-containing protein [Clostridia bacterium]